MIFMSEDTTVEITPLMEEELSSMGKGDENEEEAEE